MVFDKRLLKGLIVRSIAAGFVMAGLVTLESPLRHSSPETIVLSIVGGGLAVAIFLIIVAGASFHVYLRVRDRHKKIIRHSDKGLSSYEDAQIARLILRRPYQYADSLRDYHIAIDGERREEILAPEAEVEIRLPPGAHTIELKIDWGGSRKPTFEFLPGQRRALEVTSNAGGLFGLYYITLGRHRYLAVREVAS